MPLIAGQGVPDIDVAVQMQPTAGAPQLQRPNVTKAKRDFLAATVAGVSATFFRKALPMAVGLAIGMVVSPPVPAVPVEGCVPIIYVYDTFTDADAITLPNHTGEINAEWMIPYQVETGFTDIDYEVISNDLTGSGFSPGSENDRIAWVLNEVNALDYTVEVGITFGAGWTPDVSFAQLYLLARGTNQNFTGGSNPAPDGERAYFEFGTGGDGNMSGAFGSLDTPLSGLTPTFRTIDFSVEHTIQLRVEDGKGSILVDGVVLIGDFDTTQIAPGFVGFMLLDDADDFGMVRLTHLKVLKECTGPSGPPTPPPADTTLFLEDCSGTGTAAGRTPAVGGAYTDAYSQGLTHMTFGGGVSPIEHPRVYAASEITPPGAAYTLSFKFKPSSVVATDQVNIDVAVRRASDDTWAVELYVGHDFSSGQWVMCPFITLASGHYSPSCIDITAHVNVGAVNTAEVAISATGSVWKINGTTVATDSGVPGFAPDGVIWTNEGIDNLGGSPSTHCDVSEVTLVSN